MIPTAEQILIDARHHIEQGWTTGVEVLVKVKRAKKDNFGDPFDYRNLTLGGWSPARIKQEVGRYSRKWENEVQVCALGGIYLARAMLNGAKRKSVEDLPGTMNAMLLLAMCIDADRVERLIEKVNEWHEGDERQKREALQSRFEGVITGFNDRSSVTGKGKADVLAKFDKAIELARELGV